MQVKITNKAKHDLPKYETPGSSGMDIRANIEQTICLKPMQRTLVKTGLYLEMDPSIGLQFVDLALEIENAFGMPVDVVSRRAIDPARWKAIEPDVTYA